MDTRPEMEADINVFSHTCAKYTVRTGSGGGAYARILHGPKYRIFTQTGTEPMTE